jgi:hypothetical protein
MGAGVDFTRATQRGEGPPRRRRAVGEYYFTCLFKSFSGRGVMELAPGQDAAGKNNAPAYVLARLCVAAEQDVRWSFSGPANTR